MTRRSLTFFAASLLACGVTISAFQQAPDRSKPPAVGPAPALHVPAIEKRALSNGLQVRIVPLHKVPLVHLQIAVKAGGGRRSDGQIRSREPDRRHAGRRRRQPQRSRDCRCRRLSGRGPDDPGHRRRVVRRSPSSTAGLADALPILADVVIRPTFAASDLDRVRKDRLTSLLEAQDDPEELIHSRFRGCSTVTTARYGTSNIGTAASLQRFTAADLKAFRDANYRPGNAVLVVTGDVSTDTILPMLDQAVRTWTGTAPPPTVPATPKRLVNAACLPHRQARRRAVADPNRVDWRAAVHSGLLRAPGVEHDSRRRVHVAPEREPARTTRLRVRGVLVVRHAPRRGSLLRGRRCPDRQDRRRAPRVLRRAEAHSRTDSSRRAAESRELPRTAAAAEFRDDTGRGDVDLAALCLQPAERFLRDVRRSRPCGARPRISNASADKHIVPEKLIVVIVGDRKTIESGMRALNLGPITFVEPGEALK